MGLRSVISLVAGRFMFLGKEENLVFFILTARIRCLVTIYICER